MTVKLLVELHLVFLSLKGGCTGSSESTLVKMPHCWKSHVIHDCSNDTGQSLHTGTRKTYRLWYSSIKVTNKMAGKHCGESITAHSFTNLHYM